MLSSRSLKALLPARLLVVVALTFGSLTAALLSGSVATAQSLSPVADFVPEHTLFYAEFELDLDSDQSTLAFELLDRSNLRSLIPAEDDETIDDAVDTLGMVVDGEAAVIVTELPVDELVSVVDMASEATDLGMDPAAAATEEIPTGWAVVIHPADAEQSFEFYKSLAFGSDDTTEPAVVPYGGFEILVVEPEDEYDTPFAMALVDDVIVLASVAQDIEPVIDTVVGDTASLGSSEAFASVRDNFVPEVLSFAYVNGPAIIAEVEAAGADEALDYLESQGASLDFNHGMAYWAEDDGFHLDTISLPGESAVIPDATIYTGDLAANIPADSIAFSGGMDLGTNPGVESAALVIAQGIISEQTGADILSTPVTDPEAMADAIFAEAEEYLGFNIKTDVLDSLTGEWASAGTIGAFDGQNIPDFSAQFLTEISDPAGPTAAADAITEQIEAAGDPDTTISTRDVDGNEVTVIDVVSNDFSFTLEYGVVGDLFAFGLNSPLEFATTPASASLADDAVFVQTFEALPTDNVTSVSYTNLGLVVPLVQDVIAASSSMTGSSEPDADPACADYASQEEAQLAYDEDSFELWNLDLDFDGEACEDFFNTSTPASPVAEETVTINLISSGTVTYNNGDSIGSSSVILIGG